MRSYICDEHYSDVPYLSGTEVLMNYARNTVATQMFPTYLPLRNRGFNGELYEEHRDHPVPYLSGTEDSTVKYCIGGTQGYTTHYTAPLKNRGWEMLQGTPTYINQ
jgi:hypothetical protein